MNNFKLLILSLVFFCSFSFSIVVINDLTPSQTLEQTKFALYGQNGYSGYVNVNTSVGAHMYFIFYESEKRDTNAPVVLWLQMLGENGPQLLDNDGNIHDNPYSWNKNTALLYVDNPVGSGFSFVDKSNGYATTETTVANELYALLSVFFEKFEKYTGNDLYIFGESYAGKYIPAIGSKIIKEGNKLNLQGVGIGDGITDPINQIPSYSEYAYATGLIDLNQKKMIEAKQATAVESIKNGKFATAADQLSDITSTIGKLSGLDIYDIVNKTSPSFAVLSDFMNKPAVQKTFKVDIEWSACSSAPSNGLHADITRTIVPNVVTILNSGCKVILYNGQFDLIINLIGADTWIRKMEWNYSDEFCKAERSVWKVDNKVAGYVTNYKNLWQAMIRGAGHMVPYYVPKNSLDMLTRFINNQPFAEQ
ncbi:carboxypeptidase y [Anaeramoeba flamelloides]|uniref:Carboxypeptidase n=1 Tax=Anaeramoeba flamelloides TaxID=1746091 RepID=A0AAV7ZBK2_9EUKA|nr:carboxypeptidase y [Anaeramoeba flamelloides]KAJ6227623.1 carboxypeptidase y [Anaeramoeba flamelloides]